MSEFEELVLEKLDAADQKSDYFTGRLDEINARFDRIEANIAVIPTLSERIATIQETLDNFLAAAEKDTAALMNHEYRISTLEELEGIENVHPSHLQDYEQ